MEAYPWMVTNDEKGEGCIIAGINRETHTRAKASACYNWDPFTHDMSYT